MKSIFIYRNIFLVLLAVIVIVSATLVYLFTAGYDLIQQPSGSVTKVERWAAMSKNFQNPPPSSHNVQSQIQQNGNSSAPDSYPSNGKHQFKVPFSPRLAGQPGEQMQQGEHYSMPDVPPSKGAAQFRAPTI